MFWKKGVVSFHFKHEIFTLTFFVVVWFSLKETTEAEVLLEVSMSRYRTSLYLYVQILFIQKVVWCEYCITWYFSGHVIFAVFAFGIQSAKIKICGSKSGSKIKEKIEKKHERI